MLCVDARDPGARERFAAMPSVAPNLLPPQPSLLQVGGQSGSAATLKHRQIDRPTSTAIYIYLYPISILSRTKYEIFRYKNGYGNKSNATYKNYVNFQTRFDFGTYPNFPYPFFLDILQNWWQGNQKIVIFTFLAS